MSKTVLVLFAACVGLSLLSLHLVKQMRDGEAKISELQAQMSKLQTPLPAPQMQDPAPAPMIEPEQVPASPPPTEAPKLAAVIVPTTRVQAAQPTSGPTQEDRMRSIREQMEHQRQLMRDPDYREAMLTQYRSHMSRQYPGLARELGLTSEQTEALFTLLADQQLRTSETVPSMWDTAESDPTVLQQRQQKMQQHWQEVQRKNEAELAAQLGPQKMQAWKEYQSTLGARHEVEQLSTSLASRGMPLDEDANRSVMKAIAAMQKAERQEAAMQAKAAGNAQGNALAAVVGFAPGMVGMASGQVDTYEKFLEQSKKRDQRLLDAISPYLTPEQREAVQKEREAQIRLQEAQLRVMRQNNGSNNASGVVGSQSLILPNP